MKPLLAALLGAFALAGQAGADARAPVLVELFASQNCKVCPKAHRTLERVEQDHAGDVLVLTWSVDYWDYLGDPDPLAIPAATERQSAYAERFGLRAPYTPQSVYDGAKECPATRKQTVEANIKARRAATNPEGIEIRPGRTVFSLDGAVRGPLDVELVEFLSGKANSTGMVNPVVRTSHLGKWTGGPVSFAYDCEDSCAVIVQKPEFGEVKAAVRLR